MGQAQQTLRPSVLGKKTSKMANSSPPGQLTLSPFKQGLCQGSMSPL